MRNILKQHVLSLPIILLAGISMLHISAKAQDPQFSQFYASSLYLNPAFTGNTLQHRLSSIYRNQWPSISKAFVSYSFSYDYNLASLNSGVGFIAIRDQAGAGSLMYNNIGALYSYAFQLNKKLMARAGMKLAYTFRNYDQSELIFADQVIRGGSIYTVETKLDDGISYEDISVGGLIYSENFWGGFAFDHITQPNQSLLLEEAKLPYKFSLHGGYKFLLEGDLYSEKNKSITIAGNYRLQGKWDQIDLGFYYSRNELFLGVWYRGIPLLKSYESGYANNDAFILLIGVKANGLRMGYSYDITMSKLAMDSGGAHEISLTYEWPKTKKKRRRRFFVPCAKF